MNFRVGRAAVGVLARTRPSGVGDAVGPIDVASRKPAPLKAGAVFYRMYSGKGLLAADPAYLYEVGSNAAVGVAFSLTPAGRSVEASAAALARQYGARLVRADVGNIRVIQFIPTGSGGV